MRWVLSPYDHIDAPAGRARVLRAAAPLRQTIGRPSRIEEVEMAGDRAVALVSDAADLATVTALPGVDALPDLPLMGRLGDAGPAQRTWLRSLLADAGISAARVRGSLGADFAAVRLLAVIELLTEARTKPRFDAERGEILLDGPTVGRSRPVPGVLAGGAPVTSKLADWVGTNGTLPANLSDSPIPAHGTIRTQSNLGQPQLAGTNQWCSCWWSAESFDADQEAWMVMDARHTGTGGEFHTCLTRLQSPGTAGVDGYSCGVFFTGGSDYCENFNYRIDNGSYTQLGALVAMGTGWGSGTEHMTRSEGSSHTCWAKSPAGSWGLIATRTDSTYSGTGAIGWWASNQATRVGDMGGGSLAGTITMPEATSTTTIFGPTLSDAGAGTITLPAPVSTTVLYAPSLSDAGAPAPPDPRMILASSVPAPRPVEESIIMRGEGGQWLQIGRDAARGITHEGLSMAVDRRGPTTASFTLRRDPAVSWPDLAPFNEVLIEVGGVLVWSGRMREAPGQSGASDTIAVSASGWQAHLDDDLMAARWVHSRMSEWRDGTSFPGNAANPVLPSGLVVTTEGGEPVIGWRHGEVMRDVTAPSIGIDLGEHGPPVTRVVIEWSMRTVNAWSVAYVRGYPSSGFAGGSGTDFIVKGSSTFTAGVRTTNAGTAAAARSILIFLLRTGGNFTTTAEHLLRFHRILLFADAADEAGNASDLRASTVIREVLASGHLPHLSQDTSGIQATTFAIPDYWPQGHQSPRELMEPVNAFHDYDLGVDVERRLYFRAPAQRATIEIGAWSGAEFTDASAGSGEDVYNKVIVAATAADGSSAEVVRTAATAAPELAIATVLPALPDGGFESGSSGWTLNNVIRSNAYGAFSGSWALINSTNTSPTASFTATGLIAGMRYVLRYWWLRRLAAGGGTIGAATVTIGGVVFSPPNHSAFDVWDPVAIAFDAPSPSTTIVFSLPHTAAFGRMVDDVRIEQQAVNTVDRHGFARAARLPVSAPVTVAAAEVLGDVWLRNHIRTPLKGSVTVTAQGGVREALGGAPVHPAHLLLRHGEVLRHTGMADPDTGAWGRNGRIASISYSGGRAVVELDNERHRLEALIARYAAIAGGVA